MYCQITSRARSQECLEFSACACLPTCLTAWPWDQGHSLELKNPHQVLAMAQAGSLTEKKNLPF